MTESSTALSKSTAISDPSFEFCALSNGPLQSRNYRKLRESVRAAGLLERQYGYYLRTAMLSWSLLILGLSLLPRVRTHGLYLLDAVFLAVVFGQFAYLGHDGAHLEIFSGWRNNHHFCLLHGNLLLGLSTSWWMRKHNLHHCNPNVLALDGELEIAGVALTEEIALQRCGFMRTAAKYQAYTFFPLLTLTILALRIQSIQFVLRSKSSGAFLEALLILVHFVLYGWFVFYMLGFGRGVTFIVVHQVLFGLYMGLAFAPNHKGMPMIENDAQIDFLSKQVVTARNLFPGRITDYVYGGLNYQIEHHLFPSMPRCRLREASQIVKPFCASHSVPYAETGILESYWDILTYLNKIGTAVSKADHPSTRAA